MNFVEKFLSLIVPVYNAEKYINGLVESMKKAISPNVEFIFINDGSTDSSYEILKKSTADDERFIVVSKENGGVSTARNFGIQISKGKYIWFVDADDIICYNAIDEMCEYVREAKYDVIFFDFNFIHLMSNKSVSSDYSNVLNNCNDCASSYLLENLIKNTIKSHVWDKIISSDFIKSNNISFPIGVTNGEDGIFLMDCYDKISSYTYVRNKWYTYIIREASATSKKDFSKFISTKASFMKKLYYIKKYSFVNLEKDVREKFLLNNFKALTRVDGFSNLYNIVKKIYEDDEIKKEYIVAHGAGIGCKLYRFLHLHTPVLVTSLYLYIIHVFKGLASLAGKISKKL